MERAVTAMTIIGGLIFSLSFAVLLEELIFGGLFQLFFVSKPERSRMNTDSE